MTFALTVRVEMTVYLLTYMTHFKFLGPHSCPGMAEASVVKFGRLYQV